MTDRGVQKRLLLLGVDDGEFEWARKYFASFLERRGIEFKGPYAHTRTDAADGKAALTDGDLRRKKASWLRDVPDKVLASVLEHPEKRGDLLWGYSVIAECDWKTLTGAIDDLPEMETTETVVLPSNQAHPQQGPDMEFQPKPPKNPQAPFSYDPGQDYYTEPNRSP